MRAARLPIAQKSYARRAAIRGKSNPPHHHDMARVSRLAVRFSPTTTGSTSLKPAQIYVGNAQTRNIHRLRARNYSMSVSVAVSFAVFGSAILDVTDAVSAIDPVADALIVPVAL